jgi:ubiquinone/menaquinone biosynthesis C-methylase UbiE
METSVVLADRHFAAAGYLANQMGESSPLASQSIAASDVRFAGTIPGVYDRYLGFLFEPFARDLAQRIARIRPRRILEIAAGTGIATRQILDVLPTESHLTATDLNEPMLAFAREKFGAEPRVTFRQADALDLPFSDGEFDAVVCQFGVMFFPDRVKGLREFFRVLKGGGTLLFNTWDEIDANPHGKTAHNAMRASFEIDPPAFYQLPFGFHDVAEIRRVVTAAGFANMEIETIDMTGETPSAAEAAIGLIGGNPCINVIMERAPERLAEIESLAARTLAERYGDKPLRIPLRAHVVSAIA